MLSLCLIFIASSICEDNAGGVYESSDADGSHTLVCVCKSAFLVESDFSQNHLGGR
jgi:hypothetical protein